jgi:hypothetical protein
MYNYDSWTTKVIKSINSKMLDTLRVMQDEQVRTRANMLRAAGIDPNPNSNGYVGFEKTDFYLYKKGLITIVSETNGQKSFKITEAGLATIQA